MPHVKGPNGSVFDLPDAIASGLVGSDDGGYEYVEGPEEVTAGGTSKRRATGGASRGAGRKPRGGGSSASDGGA